MEFFSLFLLLSFGFHYALSFIISILIFSYFIFCLLPFLIVYVFNRNFSSSVVFELVRFFFRIGTPGEVYSGTSYHLVLLGRTFPCGLHYLCCLSFYEGLSFSSRSDYPIGSLNRMTVPSFRNVKGRSS